MLMVDKCITRTFQKIFNASVPSKIPYVPQEFMHLYVSLHLFISLFILKLIYTDIAKLKLGPFNLNNKLYTYIYLSIVLCLCPLHNVQHLLQAAIRCSLIASLGVFRPHNNVKTVRYIHKKGWWVLLAPYTFVSFKEYLLDMVILLPY